MTDIPLTDGGEDDQPTHRVINKRYRWGDDVYEVGDELTPPESALEHHATKFEEIDYGDEPEPEPEPDEGDAVAEADDESDEGGLARGEVPDPGEYTISALEGVVEDIGDVEVLETMLVEERVGDGRVGAAAAIEARLDELVEGDGE